MMHLLQIEWLKLRKYRAFIVMSIFFIVGVFATNYIVFLVNREFSASGGAANLIHFSLYTFPNTWQTTSYATGFILLIPALLLIMLFTNEYTYKTHRQNIIDGLSRRQFIGVKMMMALLFAAVATALVFITALVFGLASGTDFSFSGVQYVGYFFLKALTYNMIGLLISVLIKRTGFATGVFFLYLGGENFIAKLLDVWSMKIKVLEGKDIGSMGDYLPMNAADGLLTFPKNMVTNLANLPTDYTWIIFSLAILYLLLFYWWARRKFITADL